MTKEERLELLLERIKIREEQERLKNDNKNTTN